MGAAATTAAAVITAAADTLDGRVTAIAPVMRIGAGPVAAMPEADSTATRRAGSMAAVEAGSTAVGAPTVAADSMAVAATEAATGKEKQVK